MVCLSVTNLYKRSDHASLFVAKAPNRLDKVKLNKAMWLCHSILNSSLWDELMDYSVLFRLVYSKPNNYSLFHLSFSIHLLTFLYFERFTFLYNQKNGKSNTLAKLFFKSVRYNYKIIAEFYMCFLRLQRSLGTVFLYSRLTND